MDEINERKFVGRLIMSVLTERRNVREAIKLFPQTKDKNIECAYHALVHYAADEEMRYYDIEYRDAQDDYLEYIAQTLSMGKCLPRNILEEYKPYYSGISHLWLQGIKGFFQEFFKFINIRGG
jgi:hypothetical protein